MRTLYRQHTLERCADGYKVTDARGNVLARGLYDFASARREVDVIAGPHAEPVDDSEPNYE
jgi:hypothetical protein